MEKRYYNIDEEFDYLGDKYKVVESFDVKADCCANCDLFKYCVPGPEDADDEDDIVFCCASHEREDEKEVYFKKL